MLVIDGLLLNEIQTTESTAGDVDAWCLVFITKRRLISPHELFAALLALCLT